MAIIGAMIPLKTTGDESKAVRLQTPLDVLSAQSTKEQIKEAVVFVANNKEIASQMIALADCESGFKDICIIDTNKKLSCGIFMFQEATMKGYCPAMEWGTGHVADSIECAAKMIKDGLLKVHWVNCSKKIL